MAIQALKFPTVPNRQYDPNYVVKIFTIPQGIRLFIHEEDNLDDIFAQSSSYETVLQRVDEQLVIENENQLIQYRTSRIANLPLDLSAILGKVINVYYSA